MFDDQKYLVVTRSKNKKLCGGHVWKQNITWFSQLQANNFLSSVEDILFRLLLKVYPTVVLPEYVNIIKCLKHI